MFQTLLGYISAEVFTFIMMGIILAQMTLGIFSQKKNFQIGVYVFFGVGLLYILSNGWSDSIFLYILSGVVFFEQIHAKLAKNKKVVYGVLIVLALIACVRLSALYDAHQGMKKIQNSFYDIFGD